MAIDKLTYLVIENAPDVCEGIIRRMSAFEKWQSLGYCVGVKDAIEKTSLNKPDLIFLDWGLNGGSAYEVLQEIQNTPNYNPYVIFNTGFQKDNPEIPQEIINNYKVDKYLVKPLWENLRLNLATYLNEAENKIAKAESSSKKIWITNELGHKILIDLAKIICICQHPFESRKRMIYVYGQPNEITVDLQWQKCYELIETNGINYFVTKKRSHLVIKEHILNYEKPFITIKDFSYFKIEVVKENLKAFEEWLLKE